MVDPHIISAFVERWHPETSSFHMPWGEMTITLDDVRCLLHLPVRGDFYNQPLPMTEEGATALAVELLGVTYGQAQMETRKQRGGYYSQEWLHSVYETQIMRGRSDCAARAYLLLLVGCTIFADKSFTRVDAKYLPLFRVLGTCSRFCWGVAALVTLYDSLGDASMYVTKQLAGYPSLLQVINFYVIILFSLCYLINF
jgi:hypothetical protein